MADSQIDGDNEQLSTVDQEEVSSSLTRLRNDVSALSRNLYKTGRTEAANAAERIKVQADLVAKHIGTGLDKGKEKGRVAAHRVEGEITERPFIAVLLTFMIGLIIGSLLFWRKRS